MSDSTQVVLSGDSDARFAAADAVTNSVFQAPTDSQEPHLGQMSPVLCEYFLLF